MLIYLPHFLIAALEGFMCLNLVDQYVEGPDDPSDSLLYSVFLFTHRMCPMCVVDAKMHIKWCFFFPFVGRFKCVHMYAMFYFQN